MRPQNKTLRIQPKIYISYSWANEEIANTIDDDWQRFGLKLARDVRDINYKQSLKEFMRGMAQGDYVLILVSRGYLESKNCMFEALELFKDPEFKDKILPIMAFDKEDKKIYDGIGRLHYVKYWETKAAELNEATRSVNSFSNMQSIYEEINHFNKIRESIDEFSGILSDMRSVSWPDIRINNYKEIFTYIGHTLADSAMLSECNRIIGIKEVEEQEIALKELSNKFGDNEFINVTEASIAYKEGKFTKARKALEGAIAINERFSLAHNTLGNILYENFNEPIKARKHLERSLEINPRFAVAHYNLANVLRGEYYSDYKGAISHYETAIALEPDFGLAYYNLALTFQNFYSNDDKALINYQIALVHMPDDFKTNFNLANLLYKLAMNGHNKLEYYTRALELYKNAIRINPKKINAHINIANTLHIFFKEDDQALAHYRTALELEPDNASCNISLALFLKQNLHKTEEALKYYNRACDLDSYLKNPKFDAIFGVR